MHWSLYKFSACANNLTVWGTAFKNATAIPARWSMQAATKNAAILKPEAKAAQCYR